MKIAIFMPLTEQRGGAETALDYERLKCVPAVIKLIPKQMRAKVLIFSHVRCIWLKNVNSADADFLQMAQIL